MLPPTRALWIPAGLPHETASDGRATMRSLYIRPGRSPVSWTDPTPVAASPLLAELIGYLGEPDLPAGHRAHAEVLLADLLTPVPVITIGVRLPSTPTAQRVADALQADPADRRTLREWGARGWRERADAGTRVRGGGGRAVRPLADPAAAAGGAVHARRRASRSAGWRAGSATTARARSWPRSAARRARLPGRSSDLKAGIACGERQRVPGQLRRPAHRARPVPHLILRAQQHRA